MIVVTGGAGFIGSAIIWELNARGITDILVVYDDDRFSDKKKNNLDHLKYKELMGKGQFLQEYKAGLYKEISCIIHMGACSTTTESDILYLITNNYEYTRDLAAIAVENDIQFIYASSAATYGDGAQGFDDAHEKLKEYKPLNMYGTSKHLFDLWAQKQGILNDIVGIKYFNVYGPNEYHKGGMRSFVVKAFEQISSTGRVKLFKSYNENYLDGEQVRDFIYVKDAVNMTLHFMNSKKQGGIYNVGTGTSRTWNDLVKAVFTAMSREENVEYIDMPDNLKDQYQYYTCARIDKIKAAGYSSHISSLEEGIKDYVLNYLIPGKNLETS
jgi:ADP-L-glycero-D-manno-heptose 6-epimerase